MWNLTEDQYKAGFLSPAAAQFNETGELPDIFSRFGLAAELEDEEEIRTAIRSVKSIWSRLQHRNPKYDALLARLTLKAEHDRAEAILFDRGQRQRARLEIAREAEARREKTLAELERDIAAASSDECIDAKALTKLRAKWKVRGIAEEAVDQRIRVPIVHNKKRKSRLLEERQLAFGKQEREKITSCLRVLGHRDIRGFLSVPGTAPPVAVTTAMKSARETWDTKAPDGLKTAANHLLALLGAKCGSGDLTPFDRWTEWEGVQKLKVDVSLFGTEKRIALHGFKLLVQRGVEYGISESRAAAIVEDLAREEGIAVEIPAHADSVVCSNCGRANDVAAETCANQQCGQPLKVACDGCGKRISASPHQCRHCGLDGAVMPQLQHALEAATRDVARKAGASARTHLVTARTLWANVVAQRAYQDVERRLAALDHESAEVVLRLQSLVTARQFFAAQRLLGDVRRYGAESIKIGNRSFHELAAEIDREAGAANALVGEATMAVVAGEKGPAQQLYRQALAAAADCEAAIVGLSNCLPQAPASVTAAAVVGGTAIRVEWMPTSDPGVTYEVRRGTGAPVASADGGRLLASNGGTSLTDADVEPGCLYFYSVFAASGGLVSPPAVSNGLLLHVPVGDLQIRAGNGVVSGRWSLKAATGTVSVLRREPGFFKALAAPVHVPVADGAFEDRNVVNGNGYEYNVTVSYPMPGDKPVVRESGWIAAKPVAPSIGCLGLLALMFGAFLLFMLMMANALGG